MRDGRHEGVTVVTRQKGVLRSSQGCDGRNADRVINKRSVTGPLEGDEFIIFLGNWIFFVKNLYFFFVYFNYLPILLWLIQWLIITIWGIIWF